ncbi:MAG: hypothetical protein KatS3mg023_0622 [Armatimonadota bacterium]|nr:MAG: hypothetical protein KatS3mg023_0622 [Armatimonadota bacterium]
MPQPQATPSQQQEQLPVSKEQVIQAIRDGGMNLVQTAEKLGPHLQRGNLTTSQIRNIYGMVKRMEMREFNPHEFALLKPKLAYAAKRARARGAEDLKQVLSWAIDEVGTDSQKFLRFVDFFEAILAYHVAAGGK